ncbi:Crp/Fnr family transcriptional regulator [Marinoscillum sp. MHG1-6]|uniref:Crp/Fnr family transcriptional regulator n=1 Tax=Marinoscillum sp. MHG1-6 TaxID=2959627 RepID=UPI002157C8CC|nr:Crp/Fnr family transcriptional regulator [Marinoscillum sp. MHG1-6]
MKEQLASMLLGAGFEQALVDEILTVGRQKKASADSIIISPDDQGEEIPIVINGLLKVMRRDDQGNEVFLYYLEGGETCAMSITCCLEGRKSAFHVIAEEDSMLWMIPMSYMDSWVKKYSSFRKFVFASYQTRFDELLNTIESVVFMKMDERLYKYLLDKKQAIGSFVIHKTHEQIAGDLGTSRVVISRLLKKLEREEKIEQYRNRIEIL